jgi:hypothetical protein
MIGTGIFVPTGVPADILDNDSQVIGLCLLCSYLILPRCP